MRRASPRVAELEAAREERRAIKAEALSVGEEYQSTNEELLTSRKSCNR